MSRSKEANDKESKPERGKKVRRIFTPVQKFEIFNDIEYRRTIKEGTDECHAGPCARAKQQDSAVGRAQREQNAQELPRSQRRWSLLRFRQGGSLVAPPGFENRSSQLPQRPLPGRPLANSGGPRDSVPNTGPLVVQFQGLAFLVIAF